MAHLQAVIQLLAQPRRDLGQDLARVDAGVHALVDAEHDAKLVEVGFHRRLHVGVLELDRELAAVVGTGTMHLPE